MMFSATQKTKFCWVCGKDITLDHSLIDKHGLSVHQSCYEKRMLLTAASQETERWAQDQRKRKVA
jgi:hypothetical protein